MSRNPLRRPFKYVNFHACLILIFVNLLLYFSLNRSIDFNWNGVSVEDADLKSILSLNLNNFLNLKMFWQPFTYMFVHADFGHLFSNLLGLLIFGNSVEKSIGSKEFILFYFVTGLFSGLLSVLVYYFDNNYGAFLMGASGALFGVMLAFAVIFPRAVLFLFAIIPIPAPLLVVGYATLEMVNEITGFQDGVAHLTHLFGFAVAWLYFICRMGVHPIRVWKNARR